MNRKFGIIIGVAVVVVSLLAVKAMQTGSSVVFLPSELAAQEVGVNLKRVRVAGRVTSEEVQYQVEPSIELKFSIEDPETPKGSVPVVYFSLKPDMFAPGRDVIIDGEYKNGVLVASSLLTQCPSKYEPPSPESVYQE